MPAQLFTSCASFDVPGPPPGLHYNRLTLRTVWLKDNSVNLPILPRLCDRIIRGFCVLEHARCAEPRMRLHRKQGSSRYHCDQRVAVHTRTNGHSLLRACYGFDLRFAFGGGFLGTTNRADVGQGPQIERYGKVS